MPDQAPLPDFELPATGNQRFRLSAFKGRPLVPYFHPRDNTPGCTGGGAQFRDLHEEFRRADTAVCGISRDSAASHEGFKKKTGPRSDPSLPTDLPDRCPTIP